MAEEEKDKKKEQEGKPAKKFPVMIVVIAAVALVVIAGASAGVYYMVFKSKGAPKGEEDHGTKQEQVKKEEGKASGHGGEGGESAGSTKPLDPFIVNLADTQGQRYLKAVIQLETESPAVDHEINAKIPQIRDEVLMILSNKTYDDVASVAGKRMLKREITQAINKYLVEGRVLNVYFTEFVVQ